MKDCIRYSLTLFVSLYMFGCQMFVDVEPPSDQLTTETVYKDDETAKSAMIGLYIEMSQSPSFTNGAIARLTALSSDEMVSNSADDLEFQENVISSESTQLLEQIWKPGYRYIYFANTILNGLENSNLVTDEVKKRLKGEAKFIRAFAHLNLVTLFGDVPIVNTSDLEANLRVAKSPTTEVYKFVEDELEEAKLLLPETHPYSSQAGGRTYPTKWAASALLSRVLLYQGKYARAEEESDIIINATEYFDLIISLSDVFSKTSTEAIWQLDPVIPGMNTWEASIFLPTDGLPTYSITEYLLNSFEPGDKRREVWMDSVQEQDIFYNSKYTGDESQLHTELRLGEIYLIRAEARNYLEKTEAAVADLNQIRERAGLESLHNMTQADVVNAIERERQAELFGEGHRWIDLIRWESASKRLKDIPFKKWRDTATRYPVPQSEIAKNKNLLPQNKGY